MESKPCRTREDAVDYYRRVEKSGGAIEKGPHTNVLCLAFNDERKEWVHFAAETT
jgi:hypothetical protein